MAIELAFRIDFSEGPKCPTCGVGILPYGRHEPFAVTEAGVPYCREHGPAQDGALEGRHAAWSEERKQTQLRALAALDSDTEDLPGESSDVLDPACE